MWHYRLESTYTRGDLSEPLFSVISSKYEIHLTVREIEDEKRPLSAGLFP